MIQVMIQAKGDANAEPLVAALRGQVLARLLVGDETPPLAFSSATAIIAWTPMAALAPAEHFATLVAQAHRVILVRLNDAPSPSAALANAERFDWRTGGAAGLMHLLETPPAPRAQTRRAGVSLGRIAASLFATLGLMGAAQTALAAPVAASSAVLHPQTAAEKLAQTDVASHRAVPSDAEATAIAADSAALVIDCDAPLAPVVFDASGLIYTGETPLPPAMAPPQTALSPAFAPFAALALIRL